MSVSRLWYLLWEWRTNLVVISVAALLEITTRRHERGPLRIKFSPQLQFNVFYFVASLYYMSLIDIWINKHSAPLKNQMINLTDSIRSSVTLDFGQFIIFSPKITYVVSGITYLLLWDFFQYWAHRLMHVPSIFKLLHSFHHDVHMTVLNSYRHHPLEIIALNFVLNLPVAMFISVVYPQVSLPIFWTVMACFALFLHADFEVPRIPILSSLMMLPNHHRVHHSLASKDFNKNFGQYFTIWDRLFGTYRRPIYGEIINTGPKLSWDENRRSFFWNLGVEKTVKTFK